MNRRSRYTAGLSLIEVMIAMVLMALVGIMAERGLSQMVRARDAVAAEQQRWRSIAFAFGRFGEDVSFAAQGIVDETALTQWHGSGNALRWVRWGQDGQLLRVGYGLTAGQLTRSAASTNDAPPAPTVLLEQVSSLKIQLLDSGGSWRAEWPAEGSKDIRPRAVSLLLTLQGGEELRRVFALP